MIRQAAATRDVAADAVVFRALHRPGSPLLLANVWDPATARIVESVGMRAIGTASAAVAPANGYEDHGHLPPDVAIEAARRIAAAVKLPVTADLEDGYGLAADQLVGCVIEAGVCGFNIEDTNHGSGLIRDTSEQVERIAAIRAEARCRKCDLVINARVDVQVHGLTIGEGIKRAEQYLLAGADCVYPIFLSDIAAMREYVALGPTNVLLHPGLSLAGLVEAGVARVSVGPLLFQQMLKRLQLAADALRRLDDAAIWA